MKTSAPALTVVVDKLELCRRFPLLEPNLDIIRGWENLMSVHGCVRCRGFTFFQLELEAVYEIDKEPFDLQHGEFLSWTARAESDEWMGDLFAVLVKLCTVETVVVEFLL